MDQNEQQLQSLGICHRLFCFIMKTLAAQALKPVTLGPPDPVQQVRTGSSLVDQRKMDYWDVGSNNGAEDTESLASIDIEDEASRLPDSEETDWWYSHGKVTTGTGSVVESNTKAPRKVVSIKDEPEIINETNKKTKKNEAMERRNEGELRPVRSILKVGSNLSKT